MFYGLATNKVRVPRLSLQSQRFATLKPSIRRARGKRPSSTLPRHSFHAYPYLQDKYALMGCGGMRGRGLRAHDVFLYEAAGLPMNWARSGSLVPAR